MRISVTDAKAQLAELVRRAEAGEQVELTRHGAIVATLQAAQPVRTDEDRAKIAESRRRAIQDAQAVVRALKLPPGPSAARSQDSLYDEDGLPK